MESFLKFVAGRPVIAVQAGVDLLTEGTVSGKLWVLVDGAVLVQRAGTDITAISNSGAIFGEISILLGKAHTATVRTLTECQVIVIENGASFLEAHPEASIRLSRVLAARVDMLLGYLADVKTQFSDQKSHFSMLDGVMGSLCYHSGQEAELGSDREGV